jgi:hypothetical protein
LIRNIFGILFLIGSGFSVYSVCLLSFFDIPDVGSGKILIMGILFVPLIIFHLIGLALYKGVNWKISTGITLFIGGAINILVVISMVSIKSSPEISEVMDTSSLLLFSDYLSGFVVMTLFMSIGGALYFFGKSTNKTLHDDAQKHARM